MIAVEERPVLPAGRKAVRLWQVTKQLSNGHTEFVAMVHDERTLNAWLAIGMTATEIEHIPMVGDDE